MAERRQAGRMRRVRINVAAWGLGSILATVLWVLHDWQANGAFQRFAHEGNPGDWNPTLWAVVVGLWGLAVAIMALRVYVERPVTAADVDRRAGRRADPALRRRLRLRLEQVHRLEFHIGAWLLGMLVLTPLNLLIEWQDNGGFVRWSSDSQPGSWDPWVLRVGGVWALAIAVFGLWLFVQGRHDTRLRAGT